MNMPSAIVTGTFAIAVLAALDAGARWKVISSLSLDYDEVDLGQISRAFPGCRAFWIAKFVIALVFVPLLVVAKEAGAEEVFAVGLRSTLDDVAAQGTGWSCEPGRALLGKGKPSCLVAFRRVRGCVSAPTGRCGRHGTRSGSSLPHLEECPRGYDRR